MAHQVTRMDIQQLTGCEKNEAKNAFSSAAIADIMKTRHCTQHQATLEFYDNLKGGRGVTVDSDKVMIMHSTDDRYNGKSRVTLTIDQLKEKGLPLGLKMEILQNKQCRFNECICGKYKFLLKWLTQEEVDKLNAKFPKHVKVK